MTEKTIEAKLPETFQKIWEQIAGQDAVKAMQK